MKDQSMILNNHEQQQQQSIPQQPVKKTRITIKYQGSEETVGWYGATTPSKTIEDAIRTVFQLPLAARLVLKDSDGDTVAIASTLPAGETFTLSIPKENNSTIMNKQQSPQLSNSTSSITEDDFQSAESDNGLPNGDHHHSHSHQSMIKIQSSSPEVKIQDNDSNGEESSNSAQKRDSNSLAEEDDDEERKKRKRRKAVEIDRSFKCSMANCQKIYGSENALKINNNNNGLPKLLNGSNIQVPTSTLKMHLASFLAKESTKFNSNNNNNNQQQQPPNNLFSPSFISQQLHNFNNNIQNHHQNQNQNNLDNPMFLRNFQKQLNHLMSSGNGNSGGNNQSDSYMVTKDDIEELSGFIKKQMQNLKNNNNYSQSGNDEIGDVEEIFDQQNKFRKNNSNNNSNINNNNNNSQDKGNLSFLVSSNNTNNILPTISNKSNSPCNKLNNNNNNNSNNNNSFNDFSSNHDSNAASLLLGLQHI
eukprot:gene7753-9538_t